MLPAQVPDVPEGLRITAEMKQLLTALLESSNSRLGFCGMVSCNEFVRLSYHMCVSMA